MSRRAPITSVSASDLAALQPAARNMKIRQRRVLASHSGGHHSRLRGRGMEFDDVRVYQAGDDIRHIDWGITARTGTAHTKLYREERERPVMVACDLGPGMQFGTRGAFKSVRACQLAALLIWTAHLNGDRVGALLYDGRRHRALKPQRGQKGVLHLFKQISDFQEESNKLLEIEEPPESVPAMERLRRLSPTGSLVCVVSDFQHFDEADRRSLQSLGRHSELIVVQVSDPIEAELPERGRLPLQTPAGRRVIHCSPERSRQHREAFEQRQQSLRDWARLQRAHWVHCRTDDDPARCLARQLEVKRL